MAKKKTRSLYWRIITIAFRLSIVAAVVAAGYAYFNQHLSGTKRVDNSIRIRLPLECANYYPDKELKRYANTYGNIDISKVHCADKTFWASLKEIRQLSPRKEHLATLNAEYWKHFNPYAGLVPSLITFLIANFLGLVAITGLAMLSWIAGDKNWLNNKVSISDIENTSNQASSLSHWIVTILTGTIATVAGGILVAWLVGS